MADFSATDVAFTGIRFVRHNLKTVAIWAGVMIVVAMVFGGLMVVTMGPAFTQIQAQAFAGRSNDPAQAMAVFRQILPLYAVILPLSLVLYAIVWATMNRAVLRPADDSFGYIRLGMDEVRQFLLILLWAVAFIVMYIISVVLTIVLTVIGVILGPIGIVLMTGVALVIDVGGMIYVMMRLSLTSAQTFDRKRVDFFGSWRLTKGRFWKIFGTYLLAFVVAMLISLLVLIIAAALTGIFGGLAAVGTMFRPNMVSLGAYFGPTQIVMLVIWSLAAPLIYSLMLMPGPEIYRQLSGAADLALDPSTFD